MTNTGTALPSTGGPGQIQEGGLGVLSHRSARGSDHVQTQGDERVQGEVVGTVLWKERMGFGGVEAW